MIHFATSVAGVVVVLVSPSALPFPPPSSSIIVHVVVVVVVVLDTCITAAVLAAALFTGEKDKKGKGQKGKKGKKGAARAPSSDKWVAVPDAEFDPDWSSGITFSEDNAFLHANTNGHSLLNYGISAGKIAMEVTIVKETHSQVAMRWYLEFSRDDY